MAKKVKAALKKLFLGSIILFTIALAFIKFDTPAAAEFTDNVLRPLLGNNTVIYLEQLYYNFTDKLKQITFHDGLESPLIPSNESETNATTNLNLTSLAPLKNLAPIKGEGVWKNQALKLFPHQKVMAYTFIRPDKTRPYAFVTLVKLDMKVMRLAAVAGTKQPGGPIGKFGPGKIPEAVVKSNNLIAAFDGGFQYRDGQYGMVVGDTTYLPLKNDVGTLIGYQDGSLKIVDYQGQPLGSNIAFIRQNCPILIDNGAISILDPKNKHLWGRTFTADIYTWRSGLGLTIDGDLIYAVGNNLAPLTLSYALKMAGAASAIQLDINPFWVRFNIFNPTGSGQYQSLTLTKNLKDGSQEYLNGYAKDFFYLYKG